MEEEWEAKEILMKIHKALVYVSIIWKITLVIDVPWVWNMILSVALASRLQSPIYRSSVKSSWNWICSFFKIEYFNKQIVGVSLFSNVAIPTRWEKSNHCFIFHSILDLLKQNCIFYFILWLKENFSGRNCLWHWFRQEKVTFLV